VIITWVFVPLGLILPDQPNRAVQTRTLRGVGGGSCEAPPYPDMGHRYRKNSQLSAFDPELTLTTRGTSHSPRARNQFVLGQPTALVP
jgi:hypothetical protein